MATVVPNTFPAPDFDGEQYEQLALVNTGVRVERAPVHSGVYRAENLWRQAERSYNEKGCDAQGVKRATEQIQAIFDDINPLLITDKEVAKLNASLGRAYTLQTFIAYHVRNTPKVCEYQNLAIKHLTAALGTSYRHVNEPALMYELAIHCSDAAFQARKLRNDDQTAMAHLKKAVDLYENIVSRKLVLAFPEAAERCGDAYTDMNYCLRRMGHEAERIPLLEKAIEFYGIAGKNCTHARYEELSTKIANQYEVIRLINRDLRSASNLEKHLQNGNHLPSNQAD